MITLRGRTATSAWTVTQRDVWRVVGPDHLNAAPSGGPVGTAVRIDAGYPPPDADMYVVDCDATPGPGPTLHLPRELSHVQPGDVLVVSPDGTRVGVVWKQSATHNSILLTERCDNHCLMCSQPPKDRDDSELYGRARRIVSALPSTARAVSFTGGEPTWLGDQFLSLLSHCASKAPQLAVHVLSNGRKFADPLFAQRYVEVPVRDLMVGIPLYGAHAELHDYVVQSSGAFDETVRGILNLAERGGRIELRVVLQRATIPGLRELAYFICRNLPFVDQVALMGLEMTGLARPNAGVVWIDPADYRDELREAFMILYEAGIETYIYNLPLCVLHEELWGASVQSISDWKNSFLDFCEPCGVRSRCAGVFTTSGHRVSQHLAPISV